MGQNDPKPCAMKPLEQLNDDELAPLVKRAAELPDAPPDLVKAATDLFPTVRLKDVARSATRLLAAALRFDSWAGAPLAFGMRSMPDDTRHLLFSAMGRDIDLRISPAQEHFALAGQILGPDEAGRAELTAQAGGSALTRTAPIDELGEFRLDDIERGTYLLTLRMGGDEIVLPPIEVGARRG
jgi:hypothetical protein